MGKCVTSYSAESVRKSMLNSNIYKQTRRLYYALFDISPQIYDALLLPSKVCKIRVVLIFIPLLFPLNATTFYCQAKLLEAGAF